MNGGRTNRLPSGRECGTPAGMIVVVANSKGGVGKSTVAVHLAAWLRKHGRSVAVADCDAQQSSSEWCREALPDVPAVRLTTPDEIIEQLPLLDGEHEFVIADGPGSNVDTSRTLLLVAHLALVPCKASMLEVRALEQATRFVRQAHRVRSGEPRAVIILSMVGQRYRLTQDMREAAAALKLPLANTPLVLRQVYADAPGQGTVVGGMGTRAKDAAAEVDALFRELFPDVPKSKRLKPK
jgi:chromosome partitioning protein